MRKGAPPAWNATAGRTLITRSGFAFPPQPDRCSTRAPTHLAEVPFSFLRRAHWQFPRARRRRGSIARNGQGDLVHRQRRGKSTEPPARIARVQGHAVRPRLCPWGCLRPARRIPCSTFEACSLSSCAATRDRKIGVPRPAPKISLICWPNSPLTAGKVHHQKLAAGRPAAIFKAAMRSLGLCAAASGGGTAAYRRFVAACPPAPHREPG